MGCRHPKVSHPGSFIEAGKPVPAGAAFAETETPTRAIPAIATAVTVLASQPRDADAVNELMDRSFTLQRQLWLCCLEWANPTAAWA
jgi:hypothetical protein